MTIPEHSIHYHEIVTPKAEAVRDLCQQIYGWHFEDGAPELGNAFVATLPDGSLYGIREPMHTQEKPTVRNYIRVSDINSYVEEIEERGAMIALGPTKIAGRGIIAIFQFGEIQQGLWQVP